MFAVFYGLFNLVKCKLNEEITGIDDLQTQIENKCHKAFEAIQSRDLKKFLTSVIWLDKLSTFRNIDWNACKFSANNYLFCCSVHIKENDLWKQRYGTCHFENQNKQCLKCKWKFAKNGNAALFSP